MAQSFDVDPLVISSDDTIYHEGLYDFKEYLYIYIDSIVDRPIEEVAGKPFQSKFHHDTTDFFKRWIGDRGKGKACVWARLTIVSRLNQKEDWLISINTGQLDLFVPIVGDKFSHQFTGTTPPVNDRPFGGSYGDLPCLPLSLPAMDTLTIFFKLREVNSHIGNKLLFTFDRTLFKPEVFALNVRGLYFYDALSVGILLAVAIYHFFIFIFQRQKVTLYFGFFVLTMAFVILAYGGYIHEIFFPNQSILYGGAILAVVFQIGYIFHYLFSRKYLQLPQILPVWDRVWGGLLLIQILSTILFTHTIVSAGGVANAEPDFANKIFVFRILSPLPILFYAMVLAVLARFKGVKAAGLYFLAMFAYIFQHLADQAGFDNRFDLPDWLFSFSGEVILVLLFTLGIARQLKTLQDKKQAAEEMGKVEHAEALRLKGLDEFKSRFYTNITHQFRTPLTIILGMAEQIKNQPSTWLRRGTEMIKQNGLILLNLINQILDLSKLEAGSLPVQNIQTNILPYIGYLVKSFQSKAQQKQIILDLDQHEDELIMDYDPEKLSSIITNLVDNAIKFTPKGGFVRVDVCVTELDRAMLEIKVEDDGQGISEKDIPFIFDRFYQSESVNDPSAEGTGIGLALTKELVHLLNGEIKVQRLPERGTVFRVLLPITHEAPHTETFPGLEKAYRSESNNLTLNEELHYETNMPTVLVVEDNADVIEYISSILQGNYVLLTAEDGKTGLESAISNIPDIIVSDVMMPEMDGFEMTRRIKEDQRTSHIPIVLLTAKADTDSRMEGLQTGADAYLTKPFNKTELLIRVEKLVELRNTLRERYKDFRFLFEADALPQHGKSHMEDAFMKELQGHIEKRMSDPGFGINELCNDMGLSRSQLYRKFKALSNVSIAEFIRKIRLHKARHLLRNTQFNVSEVSIEVGFKNLSTFSRSFSDLFGINPSTIVKQ